jgi:hypothetical protein
MARFRWYSPVDDEGGFADWLHNLRGHDGVYLIRDARTRDVLYVGESHTGRLFETLTRHLYAWNGKGSGPSYRPELVQVAVVVAETPLDNPVADQYALIRELEPRDNVMDGHTMWWRMVTRRPKGVAS